MCIKSTDGGLAEACEAGKANSHPEEAPVLVRRVPHEEHGPMQSICHGVTGWVPQGMTPNQRSRADYGCGQTGCQ